MLALKLLIVSAALFLSSFTTLAGDGVSSLIEAVKNTKVSTLEQTLPNIIMKDWINKTFEKGREAKWESNDCGEGYHVDNPQTPTCIEVQIPQEDGYFLHINSIVSVTSKQEITKLQLWMVYFYKGEGYKTIDVIDVKTIEEAVLLYQTSLGKK